MLLGRLRVREKLALLVLLPLIAVVGTAAPLVVGRLHAVSQARRSADVVAAAVQVGTLIQQLQQERLLSLGYLATGDGRDQLVVRSAEVEDRIARVREDVGSRVSPLLLPALDTVAALDLVRTRVLRTDIDPDTLFTAYGTAIGVLIDAVSLHQDANTSTDTGRQELALDALIRHDEATSAAGAALFVGSSGQDRIDAQVIALVSASASVQDTQERLFLALASNSAKTLYRLVQEGPSAQGVQRYLSRVTSDPEGSVGDEVTDDLLPGVESLTALGRLVQIKIAGDVSRESRSAANRAGILGAVVIVVGLLLFVLVVLLSVLVAQAIAQPLRRLTKSAEDVADVAQQELVRVSDEENLDVAAPHLVPVQVGTTDELGELAAAFNRVQQVAAELVERQLISRRNVATMFGNVGRRTQNLVGRQLAMIDTLERDERDPAVLERLYRLDHVSTRLRRNANSLVVLSGAVEPGLASEPLSIADAIRSALGEIEGFQRVRLQETDEARLAPDAATDVMLLLAELLENSTSFSPPHTEVNVTAHVVDVGCQVTIVDHGIGMTDQQLAEENARLVQRERLDLAPTDVLGLFVVGRLARRHGIDVRLRPTAGTGVTAEVTIPRRCLIPFAGVSRASWSANRPAGLAEAEPNWAGGERNGRGPGRPAELLESSVPAPTGLLDPAGSGPDLGTVRRPGAPTPGGPTRQITFQPEPAGANGLTSYRAPESPTLPGGPDDSGLDGPDLDSPGPDGSTHGDAPSSFHPTDPFGSPASAPEVEPPGSYRPAESPGGPGEPESFQPDGEERSDRAGGPDGGELPTTFHRSPAAPEPFQPDEDTGYEPLDEPSATGSYRLDEWDDVAGYDRDELLDLSGFELSGGPPEPPQVARRVPGAQLPDPGPAATPSWSLRETPEDARKVVEDFEAGVDRAEREIPPSEPADPGDLDLPLLDRWERLRRRVPGSHLPQAPGLTEPGEPPLTPDSARALVEEFETGVKRALDNLAAVTARYAHTEGTAPSGSPFAPADDASAAPGASAAEASAVPAAPPAPAGQPPVTRRIPQATQPEPEPRAGLRPESWPPVDRRAGRHGGRDAGSDRGPDGPSERPSSPAVGAAAEPSSPLPGGSPDDRPTGRRADRVAGAATGPSGPDGVERAAGETDGEPLRWSDEPLDGPLDGPTAPLAAGEPAAGAPDGPARPDGPTLRSVADTADPAGAGDPAGPLARPGSEPDGPADRLRAGAAGAAGTGGDTAGDRNGTPRPGQPEPPPGRRNPLIRLNRRVPGAQLPDTGSRVTDLDPAPELDPDAARALVEEFEAGVARAMGSVEDGRSSPGDPERTGSTEGSER